MRQAWFKLSGSVAGRALLWLLSLLYGAACAIRQIWISCFPHERSVPYPVISVGNMTAGGTGKTTLTLYLVQELMARGYRAVVLTRGYKGGDEARLLEEKIGTHGEFKVLVGRNRYETARDYLDSKFKISDSKLIFIMDDGHQHTALKKDLSLVLIDASNPEALRGLLPYGWLREPLVWGLKRADAVIITHADAVKREDLDRLSARVHQAQPGLAVFYARHEVVGLRPLDAPSALKSVESFRNAPVILVSGIGNPRAFESTAIRSGLVVKEHLAFEDHAHFDEFHLARIEETARRLGCAMVVTTAKDAVRCPVNTGRRSLSWHSLDIRWAFEGKTDEFWRLLQDRIDRNVHAHA